MKIDFIGRTKIWAAVSGAVIIISVVALVAIGLNFSVEFTGGTSLDIKFKQRPPIKKVRDTLGKFGLQKSIIQPVGSSNMLIRFRQPGLTQKKALAQQEKVQNTIKKSFKVIDINAEQVGPEWGALITNAALLALFLSLAGILIYISLRFEFKMAVSAIAALFHDIAITIGIYALVGREVSPATVAAILTITGYSLYDTIVVFHKIVENSKTIQKDTYANMANRSINQVLMRSINTSLTTTLPVIAVLVFGGETLKDFAFALLIGLITGAYSSIFVAPEILTIWKETEPRYANLKRKYAQGQALGTRL